MCCRFECPIAFIDAHALIASIESIALPVPVYECDALDVRQDPTLRISRDPDGQVSLLQAHSSIHECERALTMAPARAQMRLCANVSVRMCECVQACMRAHA
eukprot:6174598-Pleurochrysis_carterae.AAC.1